MTPFHGSSAKLNASQKKRWGQPASCYPYFTFGSTVEDMVRDSQVFFRGCAKPIVVFDEVHQLRDPARVLKIGADRFPKLKRLVHLTPVTWDELPAFGATLPRRLFLGG